MIIKNSIEKRKKLLDIPENVVTILAIQAAIEGKSVKAFMENVLIATAEKIDDGSKHGFLKTSFTGDNKSENINY